MFAPEKGNVAFASAADGWAFRIGQFAALYAAKMGANQEALGRAMWGDFAFQAKSKRIVRIRPQQQGKAKPLFVQARCVQGCLLADLLWHCVGLSVAAAALLEVCRPPTWHAVNSSHPLRSQWLSGLI